MTDYETASLALQQASVWAIYVQAGVALVIGGLQCGLIYVGLRRMGEASTERKAQHDETMTALKTQHEASMAAHEASMTALTELIRRPAPPLAPKYPDPRIKYGAGSAGHPSREGSFCYPPWRRVLPIVS